VAFYIPVLQHLLEVANKLLSFSGPSSR